VKSLPLGSRSQASPHLLQIKNREVLLVIREEKSKKNKKKRIPETLS